MFIKKGFRSKLACLVSFILFCFVSCFVRSRLACYDVVPPHPVPSLLCVNFTCTVFGIGRKEYEAKLNWDGWRIETCIVISFLLALLTFCLHVTVSKCDLSNLEKMKPTITVDSVLPLTRLDLVPRFCRQIWNCTKADCGRELRSIGVHH